MFPNLPQNQVPILTYTGPHTLNTCMFLESLVIDDPLVVERNTRGKSNCPVWFNMRKNRLTSSNIGAVCKCKSNMTNLKQTLLNLKEKREKNTNSLRNTIILMQCGMIINSRMLWLSTSPHRKVLDSVFEPGIVEIKCPYTFRNLKPEEACRYPKFFCCLVDGKPTLKKDHNYYFQIQGRLGICGLP